MQHRWMEAWERFVESLATAGGSVFLLVALVILFARAEIHLAYHPEGISQNLTVTLSNILMAFVGALVQALQSRAKPPGGEAGSTIKTDTVTKVQTLSGPANDAEKPADPAPSVDDAKP